MQVYAARSAGRLLAMPVCIAVRRTSWPRFRCRSSAASSALRGQIGKKVELWSDLADGESSDFEGFVEGQEWYYSSAAAQKWAWASVPASSTDAWSALPSCPASASGLPPRASTEAQSSNCTDGAASAKVLKRRKANAVKNKEAGGRRATLVARLHQMS